MSIASNPFGAYLMNFEILGLYNCKPCNIPTAQDYNTFHSIWFGCEGMPCDFMFPGDSTPVQYHFHHFGDQLRFSELNYYVSAIGDVNIDVNLSEKPDTLIILDELGDTLLAPTTWCSANFYTKKGDWGQFTINVNTGVKTQFGNSTFPWSDYRLVKKTPILSNVRITYHTDVQKRLRLKFVTYKQPMDPVSTDIKFAVSCSGCDNKDTVYQVVCSPMQFGDEYVTDDAVVEVGCTLYNLTFDPFPEELYSDTVTCDGITFGQQVYGDTILVVYDTTALGCPYAEFVNVTFLTEGYEDITVSTDACYGDTVDGTVITESTTLVTEMSLNGCTYNHFNVVTMWPSPTLSWEPTHQLNVSVVPVYLGTAVGAKLYADGVHIGTTYKDSVFIVPHGDGDHVLACSALTDGCRTTLSSMFTQKDGTIVIPNGPDDNVEYKPLPSGRLTTDQKSTSVIIVDMLGRIHFQGYSLHEWVRPDYNGVYFWRTVSADSTGISTIQSRILPVVR